MPRYSASKLQQLANEAESLGTEYHDRRGGSYIDHFYEAAWGVANSELPAGASSSEVDALAGAIMKVAGYEAKHPSGKPMAPDHDLPAFYGRGDEEFTF